MSKGKKISIFRFNPSSDQNFHFEEHVVPPESGAVTVIDALFYLQRELENPPAFRAYTCQRGQCASCVMTINGTTKRACSTQLEDEMTIKPAKNFPIVRDLVVDFGRQKVNDEVYFINKDGALTYKEDYRINKEVTKIPRVHMEIMRPERCKNCEAKDCVYECPVNQQETLARIFGEIPNTREGEEGERVYEACIRINDDGVAELVGTCPQCTNAPCIDVCPTGAIYFDEEAKVIAIDPEECIGCELCAQECNHNIIFMAEDRSYAVKCDFCGGDPICVDKCPENNIKAEIVGYTPKL